MAAQKRSITRVKSDLLVGVLRLLVHLLLAVCFFFCLSRNNIFLRHINRTLATTILTYSAMTLAMHAVYGGYDVGRKKSKPVISAMIASAIITDCVTYLQLEIMNVNDNYNSSLTLFGPDFGLLLLCILLQILLIIVMVRLGNDLYFRLTPPKSCLVILGKPEDRESLLHKIGRYRLQWRVDDVILYDAPDLEARVHKADVVFLDAVPDPVRNNLLRICYDERKDVMCKAGLQEIMLCNAKPAIVDDTAFLDMEFTKSTLFQRLFKRTGDILLSAAALILLSPFILLISMLILLEDGGPIIFRQHRMTADGRIFTIRKFRTMKVSDQPTVVQTSVTQDDPRITKVGHFLRRFRLDELPQFWNILLGDMSLVGPRPEMMENVTRYKLELPNFVYREKMKAGLTGYAQIEGRYNTTAEDKLMLDLMYIESFSIWLDIKLLLRTFTVLLKSDSTQGFQPDAVGAFVETPALSTDALIQKQAKTKEAPH